VEVLLGFVNELARLVALFELLPLFMLPDSET